MTLDCGIQEQKIERPVTMPDPKFFQPAAPVAPNPDALAAAADALLGSKLPLIVGGRFGINPAVTKPLVELVELTGARLSRRQRHHRVPDRASAERLAATARS